MADWKKIGYIAAIPSALIIGNSIPYSFVKNTYEFFATPHYVAGPHQAHRSTLELSPDRVYQLDNKDCMYVDGSLVETKGINVDGKKLTTGNLCFTVPKSTLEKKCQELAKQAIKIPDY